jgi:hypothetical protein
MTGEEEEVNDRRGADRKRHVKRGKKYKVQEAGEPSPTRKL